MICRLPGPAVEKSGEILREASTALKLAQRLDQRSFFVVEELHLGGGICGEPRLENHAEIVGRGVGRARLELLDEQLGDFAETVKSRSLIVMLSFLAMSPGSLRLLASYWSGSDVSALRGHVASQKFAASLIPKAADPKTSPAHSDRREDICPKASRGTALPGGAAHLPLLRPAGVFLGGGRGGVRERLNLIVKSFATHSKVVSRKLEDVVTQALEELGASWGVHRAHPLELADPGGMLDLERAVGLEAAAGERMSVERFVVGRPEHCAWGKLNGTLTITSPSWRFPGLM